jgi:hypothetical protein
MLAIPEINPYDKYLPRKYISKPGVRELEKFEIDRE